MDQAEQDLRVQLGACYRVFDYMGWSELIFNHITVKVPGEDSHFLINPYGLAYSEVTASNLLKVDINGEVIDVSPYKANPAGMLIHSTIHGAREDAHCIGHVHTDAGMAVACQENGLRTDNFYSVLLYNRIAYHDFEGLTVSPDEKERMLASLGDKDILILRNHGLLTCGRTIPEMFMNMWLLQRACEIQIASDSTGKPSIDITEEIGEKSAALLKIQMAGNPSGELEFNAMVRKVNAIDSSYKNLD